MSTASTHPLTSPFRGAIFSTAIITGILLTIVMITSLYAANRMAGLEQVAWLRNLLSSGAFALVMAIPVARFVRRPWCLFSAGITSWAIFVASYSVAGVYFDNLVNRLGKTPFLMLVLGAITYGVISVVVWVVSMLFGLLRHPAVAVAHRPATVEVAPRPR
jgi:hypothetical protein